MMTSNKEQLELAKEGKCPLCGHWDIGGGPVEINGKYASQTVCCGQCDSEWIELYTLTKVTIVSEGEGG